MDSPHRQARTIARTSARQERSSPYARPRNPSLALEPTLPRAPSSSFLGLLGRAVSWWVGTGPPNEIILDEEGRRSDEEMPDQQDDEFNRAVTPLGPPGGFGRLIPVHDMAEVDDDEVQIIPPPPQAPPPARPVFNSQPPQPFPKSSFNLLNGSGQPTTPQNSLSRAPPQAEDTSPERINAAISDFFARKGSEPLSIVEYNGVQKMLEDLRGSGRDGSSESFKLGSPAYSTPAFHPGTPDRSSQLRSTRSTSVTPRRATPGRPRTTPIYIGPGFGSSRMRSSAKPEPKEPTMSPSPAEKSNTLTRSTLSASMLTGPSSTPSTPVKASEPINPTLSRLTSKPTVPSPLRNTIPQDSRSPGSDRISPPKRGPTIAASILKDLMDSDKKESPLQNPYLNKPGAIKGKVKPKVKLSDKPVTPFRTVTEAPKPAVNGNKPAEPITGAKRDAEAAALDEITPPKAAPFTGFGAKEQSSEPSPSAPKKPRTSYADAQEVDELLEDDSEGAVKPSTDGIFETTSASQGAEKPAMSTPLMSLPGANGGFSFPKPVTSVPSFGPILPSSNKSDSSASALTSFGTSPATAPDASVQKAAKPSAFGGSGLFSNGSKPSPFASTTSAFAAFEKPADKPVEPSTTPVKPPPANTDTLFSAAPSLGGFGSAAAQPPSTSAFGASNVFGMGGAAPKPASEPLKEPAQPPKTSLFGFGPTSNAFGSSSPPVRAPSLGSFGLSNAPSSKASSATLAFPSSFGATSPSSTTTPSTSPFGKTSTNTTMPATSSFGKDTGSAPESSDKPLTFSVPSGFKSPFADTTKASTNAFGGTKSLFVGIGGASSSSSPSGASPTKTPPVADTSSSKDVNMDAERPAPASNWEKILAQSTYHKGEQTDSPTLSASKSDDGKEKLPVFAFHVQTPVVPGGSSSVSISKDKLPSFLFDTKLAPALPRASVGGPAGAAPSTPAPIKPAAPVVGFDFAAAGLTKPTTPIGSWTCGVCMVSNKVDASKCAACESDRPGASASVAPLPSTTTPASVPKKPAAPIIAFDFGAAGLTKPVASSGNWTCDTCMVSNKSDAVKCVACETARP